MSWEEPFRGCPSSGCRKGGMNLRYVYFRTRRTNLPAGKRGGTPSEEGGKNPPTGVCAEGKWSSQRRTGEERAQPRRSGRAVALVLRPAHSAPADGACFLRCRLSPTRGQSATSPLPLVLLFQRPIVTALVGDADRLAALEPVVVGALLVSSLVPRVRLECSRFPSRPREAERRRVVTIHRVISTSRVTKQKDSRVSVAGKRRWRDASSRRRPSANPPKRGGRCPSRTK